MIRGHALKIALRGIGANKLRSFLTMLGMMIGVAAVIVLVAVGNGSQKQVENNIDRLGTNTLTVFQGGAFGGRGASSASRNNSLTMADADALDDPLLAPDVKSVSPTVAVQSQTLTYNGSSYQPGQFTGTVPTYFTAANYEIASGSLFDDNAVTDHRKVIVLGATVADSLFPGQDPVGQTVTINGNPFVVLGTLKAKGSAGAQNGDDVVFTPITTVQGTLVGGQNISGITVQAVGRSAMDDAQAEVESILNTRHPSTNGQASFQVLNQASLLETSNETNHVLTVLLGAVAAISLLVGGIGIMNIMLVTVTERTREIGIRKAIGARQGDIMRQFVFEAVLLSVLGGLLGVAVGLVGSQFKIVGVNPVIAPYSVVLAFAFAIATGLFFGIYPASRAARLTPIDALRYE